jgi:hypothetical protein
MPSKQLPSRSGGKWDSLLQHGAEVERAMEELKRAFGGFFLCCLRAIRLPLG